MADSGCDARLSAMVAGGWRMAMRTETVRYIRYGTYGTYGTDAQMRVSPFISFHFPFAFAFASSFLLLYFFFYLTSRTRGLCVFVCECFLIGELHFQ